MSQDWIYRLDTVKSTDKNYEIDSHGFLRFIAPISRTGYLEYIDRATNKPYQEYVSPETLIRSLDSCKTIPITDSHPSFRVTPKNSKQVIRGLTGYTGYFDGSFLWLTGTATDQELIEKIQRKDSREISLGYDALVAIAQKGDQTLRSQITRKCDHLAFVPEGRNGEEVALRLDSVDNESSTETSFVYAEYSLDAEDLTIPDELFDHFRNGKKIYSISGTTDTKDKTMPVSLFFKNQVYNIDGVDAERLKDALTTADIETVQRKADSADTLTAEIAKLQNDIAKLQTDKATVDGQLLAVQTKLDEAETKLKDQPKIADPSADEIEKRLQTWSEVETFMRKADAKFAKDYSLSPHQIKKEYLLRRLDGNSSKVATIQAYDPMTPEGKASIEAAYLALHPSEYKIDADDTSEGNESANDIVLKMIETSTKTDNAENKKDYQSDYVKALEKGRA